MPEPTRRTAFGLMVDVTETAIFSAALAAATAAAIALLILGPLAMRFPGVTDPLQAIWVLPLPAVAAAVAALAGIVFAGIRRPLPLQTCLVVATTSLAATTVVGFLGRASMLAEIPFVMTAYVGVGLLLPLAAVAVVQRALARRSSGTAVVMRLAAGLLLLIAIGWKFGWQVARAKELRTIAISEKGQVYLATGQPRVLAYQRETKEWKTLPAIPRAEYLLRLATDPNRPESVLAQDQSTLWEYDPKSGWIPATGAARGLSLEAIAAAKHGLYALDRFGSIYIRRPDPVQQWEVRSIRLNGKTYTFNKIAVFPDRPGFALSPPSGVVLPQPPRTTGSPGAK